MRDPSRRGLLCCQDPAPESVNEIRSTDDPLVYFLMPRYGYNLESILIKRNFNMSSASIFHLGLSLLNTLEIIHNSGLVYNDLKFDNILVGYN